jgi:hypothetical protein
LDGEAGNQLLQQQDSKRANVESEHFWYEFEIDGIRKAFSILSLCGEEAEREMLRDKEESVELGRKSCL